MANRVLQATKRGVPQTLILPEIVLYTQYILYMPQSLLISVFILRFLERFKTKHAVLKGVVLPRGGCHVHPLGFSWIETLNITAEAGLPAAPQLFHYSDGYNQDNNVPIH